ncbi:hypothetical protein HU200_059381 [Digitaria exilis]|uniref:Uncharacterized protein n=1 Tax=Digitaria exilis TaxID=1010633 RepID=A0A835A8Z3_9POAL|nr:hypothetical protein HU200_059381 [Digitaria exilis]
MVIPLSSWNMDFYPLRVGPTRGDSLGTLDYAPLRPHLLLPLPSASRFPNPSRSSRTLPLLACRSTRAHTSPTPPSSTQMGCGFSSTSSPAALRPCEGVRVIHTNGYVEDFLGPGVITVAHVTGCFSNNKETTSSASSFSPPRYVLCSRGPFRPDDQLQPGTVYFLLPQSVFQSESSAVDLACLMNRLTALARKGCATAAPASNPIEALFAGGASATPQQQAHAGGDLTAKSPCRPAPWRPRLERIDESIGRNSMRSASSRSACSEA